MAYDAVRGRVILSGGIGAKATIFGDTWEWDGSTWTRLELTGPQLYAPMLWWNGSAPALAGGTPAVKGLWQPTGSTWTQYAVTGDDRYKTSPGKMAGTATWDSARARSVFFLDAETWEYY
jgi:hypothetical protein